MYRRDVKINIGIRKIYYDLWIEFNSPGIRPSNANGTSGSVKDGEFLHQLSWKFERS